MRRRQHVYILGIADWEYDIIHSKRQLLKEGTMKYKEGNGVAEKSFVSIGEDNRRRLDELEARVALLEEILNNMGKGVFVND